jgi:hypothetical protein
MKKLFLILFLIAWENCYSQEPNKKILNGILTTKNGTAIPGCNVLLVGSKTGTVTDICGEFSIQIPSNYNGRIAFNCMTPNNWEGDLKKVQNKKIRNEKVLIFTLVDWKNFENAPCERKIDTKGSIKLRY